MKEIDPLAVICFRLLWKMSYDHFEGSRDDVVRLFSEGQRLAPVPVAEPVAEREAEREALLAAAEDFAAAGKAVLCHVTKNRFPEYWAYPDAVQAYRDWEKADNAYNAAKEKLGAK